MTTTASYEQLKLLKQFIDESKTIIFYGGAGTSTESGIPDYRSKHGIWTAMTKDGFDPVKYANPQFMKKHPEKFFAKDEERDNRPIPVPNATHKILTDWEQSGKDIRIITQNVDGLHQKAGHRYVLELHGHHRIWYCMACGREYLSEEVERDKDNVPRCFVCEGIVRPNVVYFGENASKDTVEKARKSMRTADLLIIAGTSLTTPLAKRLIYNFEGDKIAVINLNEVDISPLKADLFIQDWVGEVMTTLSEMN